MENEDGKSTYTYKYGVGREKGLFYIELEDATRLVFSDGTELEEGVSMQLPREKFERIHARQVEEYPDAKYLEFTFSTVEIDAIREALRKIRGDLDA